MFIITLRKEGDCSRTAGLHRDAVLDEEFTPCPYYVVRLPEIPSGQFIRIRLKIDLNCRLFTDIFSSAVMNDLSVSFTPRLKVDVKCVYQQ